MTFKTWVISLEFWVKNKAKTELDPEDVYYSLEDYIAFEGNTPYEEMELFGEEIELMDGHIMNFDNIIEN